MGTEKGKAEYNKACVEALEKALIDFGFTSVAAKKIAGSGVITNNVDIPFKFGRLVINKGSIDRYMRKGK